MCKHGGDGGCGTGEQQRVPDVQLCVGSIGLNDAMITMQAVIEVPAFDAGPPPPWPVAPMAPWSWLVLDADCTDEQAGLFVAALADPTSRRRRCPSGRMGGSSSLSTVSPHQTPGPAVL